MKSIQNTLWDCYQKGFQEKSTQQVKRHNNPPGEIRATQELTDEITKLVSENILAIKEAKALAKKLGRLEYGERGLTLPIAQNALREIMGTRYDWLIARRFEGKTPHN